MLKIYTYWHKCSCHACTHTRTDGHVKVEQYSAEAESAIICIFLLLPIVARSVLMTMMMMMTMMITMMMTTMMAMMMVIIRGPTDATDEQ